MRSIFADTSALFSLIDRTDRYHKKAIELSKKTRKENLEIVISDHILSETITLVRNKIGFPQASLMGIKLFDSRITTLIIVDENILKMAWDIFLKYTDKDFSFVDCISFAVMKQTGIDTAFTFDHHFVEIGFRILGR